MDNVNSDKEDNESENNNDNDIQTTCTMRYLTDFREMIFLLPTLT